MTAREITEVIEAAKTFGAASVSLPAVDTVLTAENGNYKEIESQKLRLMQTPQAVRGDILQNLNLPKPRTSHRRFFKNRVKIVEASPPIEK